MAKHHEIRMGTCGWDHDAWVGSFYPGGTTEEGYLAAYAQHFDLVEADSTFERVPTEELVDHWRIATPRRFQFTLRAPRFITHEKVLEGCRDDFRAFVEVAGGLEKKLNCILLQFDYFAKQAFPQARLFYDRLDKFLAAAGGHVPVAVEIRNRTWLGPEWFDLLRRHKVISVLSDHPWMPSIAEMLERYDPFTGPAVYLRLTGERETPNTPGGRDARSGRGPAVSLPEVAAAVQQISTKSNVIVIASDQFAGSAPDTITQLSALIGLHTSIEQ